MKNYKFIVKAVTDYKEFITTANYINRDSGIFLLLMEEDTGLKIELKIIRDCCDMDIGYLKNKIEGEMLGRKIIFNTDEDLYRLEDIHHYKQNVTGNTSILRKPIYNRKVLNALRETIIGKKQSLKSSQDVYEFLNKIKGV